MAPVFEFAGHFWWLIFPLMGVAGGAVRAVSAANERRAQRRLERYRIKQETKVALAHAAAAANSTEASGRTRNNETAYRREMTKVLKRHDDTDARWLDYEIDIAKLLDFPLMTDMRDPLTIDFHKTRSHADLLRPDNVEDILGDRAAQLEYRDAVHEYVTAFDVAETEAIRRRRSDFSVEARERIERAQHLLRLASDVGATNEERKSAYAHAQRELNGLIVLPAVTRASIERKIAGEIEA